METYTEEEFKRHSGTHLEDSRNSNTSNSEDGSSESELDLEMEELDGSSIVFQNETSSDDSYGTGLSEEDDSDSFISANEDVTSSEEPFLSSSSPQGGGQKGSSDKGSALAAGGGKGRERKEEEEEGVFIDNFSDESVDSGEGRNMLGKLETEVMNLSFSRFRQ